MVTRFTHSQRKRVRDMSQAIEESDSSRPRAIEVPRAIVIQVATWYEEELVLETVCRDYDHYVSLPDVVVYQDRLTGNKPVECGKTGWSSDRNYACYKSGACIAHGK